MRLTRLTSVVALAVLQLACDGAIAPGPIRAVEQATVAPNTWTCATYSDYLGRNLGNDDYVIVGPVSGVYQPIDASHDSIMLNSSDGIIWSWTSSTLIRAVFVRADVPGTPLGDATNQLWLYAGPSGGGAFSGIGIYSQDASGTQYPARFMEFCFDAPPPQQVYSVQITKTARMSYTTTYQWNVSKLSDVSALTLAAGESYAANFIVEVGLAGSSDGAFQASGQIFVHNPAPVDATITGVTDEIAGASTTVDCGVQFPFTLAAGADLICTWTSELAAAADITDVATVTTDPAGSVLGGSASATALVADADVTVVDRCADVFDSVRGQLGRACELGVPMSFFYSQSIGPFESCGSHDFTNTASTVGIDTGATSSSSVTIPVTVPCVGCTLSAGYWKTHSMYGPSPYDDTWALVGENTAFFLSGNTWYAQFHQPPAGNAYWQLSHAYATARLNELDGASTDSIQAAMATALALLQTHTPADVKASSSLRAQFVSAASTLDDYNLGLTGPGPCSE